MRNAKKNPGKFPILQWRGKSKSDAESAPGAGSPAKVSQFFCLVAVVGPIITPSFNKIGSQTERMNANRTDRIISTLAEVINNNHRQRSSAALL